jgi:hypothetical protein
VTAAPVGSSRSTVARPSVSGGPVRCGAEHRGDGVESGTPHGVQLIVDDDQRGWGSVPFRPEVVAARGLTPTRGIVCPRQSPLKRCRDRCRVTGETIYQASYLQARGELATQLRLALRTGRAERVPRGSTRPKQARIARMVNISERPPEVADRAVPGTGRVINGPTLWARS